jgi:hypothetical protein
MKKYYYSNGVDQRGPVALAELKSVAVFGAGTLVWYAGLPEWVRAVELPELSEFFAPSPPPPSLSPPPPPAPAPRHPELVSGSPDCDAVCLVLVNHRFQD